jgi:hypothetical protein
MVVDSSTAQSSIFISAFELHAMGVHVCICCSCSSWPLCLN